MVPALMYSTLLCISINKQLKISADFYLGFARERFKRYVISNVSIGNIPLHYSQHVACKICVKQVCVCDILSNVGSKKLPYLKK